MQKSQGNERRVSPTLLDSIGGEPLAGSGFEKEDPEEDFSITEEAIQE